MNHIIKATVYLPTLGNIAVRLSTTVKLSRNRNILLLCFTGTLCICSKCTFYPLEIPFFLNKSVHFWLTYSWGEREGREVGHLDLISSLKWSIFWLRELWWDIPYRDSIFEVQFPSYWAVCCCCWNQQTEQLTKWWKDLPEGAVTAIFIWKFLLMFHGFYDKELQNFWCRNF